MELDNSQGSALNQITKQAGKACSDLINGIIFGLGDKFGKMLGKAADVVESCTAGVSGIFPDMGRIADSFSLSIGGGGDKRAIEQQVARAPERTVEVATNKPFEVSMDQLGGFPAPVIGAQRQIDSVFRA